MGKTAQNNRSNYLFKNTFIFALSALATKLITFFLIPLYTNEMPPQEYGIVDLLFTIGGFLVPLLSLNVTEAIYRFSMDKDKNGAKIFSVGIICFLFATISALLVIPILKSIPGYEQYSFLYYIYIVTLTLSQMLLSILKGEEKLKQFSIGNVTHTFFVAIFNIIFLAGLKMGAFGYFCALILSNVITILYGLFYNVKKINRSMFQLDTKLLKTMLKYSIVLIPTSFMWWIINSSDRLMISAFIGSYANGIYAVSYKIPSLLTIVASIFNQAWVFSAIREKDSMDNEQYTNKVFHAFFTVTCMIGMVAFIISKTLFKFYVAKDYYSAWEYVPILVIGFIFMVAATFISASYNVHKDSKGFLFSAITGAITNVLLNLALMPFLGVYGAAIATAISYIVVFIYRMIDTKKYVRLKFTGSQVGMLVLTLLCAILTYIDNPIAILVQIIILLASILIYKKQVLDLLKAIKEKLKTKGKKLKAGLKNKTRKSNQNS